MPPFPLSSSSQPQWLCTFYILSASQLRQEGSVVLWSEQQFENPEVRALSLVLGDGEATKPQSLRCWKINRWMTHILLQI